MRLTLESAFVKTIEAQQAAAAAARPGAAS
jgi:hypothetical protein